MNPALPPSDGTIDVNTVNDNKLTLTHIIYALHALSALGGLGSATIVGSFVFGWPSIIAVALNYFNRSAVRGTWLESHFSWQIRTFWWTMLWGAIAMLLLVILGWIVIGIVFATAILSITGIWILYRVVRGWLALKNRQVIGV